MINIGTYAKSFWVFGGKRGRFFDSISAFTQKKKALGGEKEKNEKKRKTDKKTEQKASKHQKRQKK